MKLTMLGLPTIDWEQLGAVCGVIGVLWLVGVRLLARDFVTQSQFTEFKTKGEFFALDKRVTCAEVTLLDVATRSEMAMISGQISIIQVSNATLEERSINTVQGVGRVEHQLQLLMKSLLDRERDE